MLFCLIWESSHELRIRRTTSISLFWLRRLHVKLLIYVTSLGRPLHCGTVRRALRPRGRSPPLKIKDMHVVLVAPLCASPMGELHEHDAMVMCISQPVHHRTMVDSCSRGHLMFSFPIGIQAPIIIANNLTCYQRAEGRGGGMRAALGVTHYQGRFRECQCGLLLAFSFHRRSSVSVEAVAPD